MSLLISFPLLILFASGIKKASIDINGGEVEVGTIAL